MADFDYTDIQETGGLPLGQEWERAAAKDLADMMHYLTHGLFINVVDYAERLKTASEAISAYATPTDRAEFQSSPLFPGTGALERLGEDTEPIEFLITPARAFILLAQLQLALRHPGNVGESVAIAREVALKLQAAVLSKHPELEGLCNAGWQHEYDTSRAYFDAEFGGLDSGV